jgi:hypothetical protein
VAIPGYLEANGRVALPERLRPAPGATIEVALLPRPPLSTATLVNADPAAVSSIAWIDEDGGSHLEPLWLLVDLPSGDPSGALPPPEGLVEADRYGGTFLRVRATTVNLSDGLEHPFEFVLATVAGPGGEVLATTAELRAMAAPVWYDIGGTLGKAYAVTGAELSPAALADRIDSGELVFGRSVASGAGGHPELHLTAGPSTGRRRATLGDLVTMLGEPARVLQLREASANEIDAVGVAIPPAPPAGPLPTDPWRSGVTAAELARAMSVGMPANPGPVTERLDLAIRTAEDAIGYRLGRRTVADWPDGIPAGARTAVLQVATRVYRASDVTFGVLQTELGSTYVGRWVTPEVELSLLGLRRKWGIA